MMKRIIVTILILSIIALSGCVNLDDYVTVEEYDNLNSTLNSTIDDYGKLLDDYNNLKGENYNLKSELRLSKEETVKYRELVNNLNKMLDSVYYGYGSNSNWESDGFTAFSIEYKGKFYILTAGHCVHYKLGNTDTGLYTTIKIRNNNGEWIYPELLAYENDLQNNLDYAVLYSDKIRSGLEYNLENSYPKFVLGSNNRNILKEFNHLKLIDGESGSPIVDLGGEIIEIVTGSYTDIDVVLEAIDKLE